MMGWSDKW